jgi:galactose-1-phosphate uridylyltransferase
VTSESLVRAFLSFFQQLVRHDTRLEILLDFKQTTAIHINDHIHEWHQRRILCKEETTKEHLLDWFLKSFVSIIPKDVASTFPQLEEEEINKAQQFYLIYSQSSYLYIVSSIPSQVTCT